MKKFGTWLKINQALNFIVNLFTKKNAKIREFDGEIKTDFLGNGLPKENMYYTCIACITIDSVIRMNKKNYPQVYLDECKYKIKKIQMPRFINVELESDLDSEAEAEAQPE